MDLVVDTQNGRVGVAIAIIVKLGSVKDELGKGEGDDW